MKKRSAPTIHDVAKLAEVSAATVSKVLNQTPGVSEPRRERVLNAIQKLNYQPNTIARSLRKQHTRTIGIVTDDLDGEFTVGMMRGVEDVANAQGFSVFLCNSQDNRDRERANLETLLAKQVDGVVLLSGYRVRERGAPAAPLGGVPIVYLYQYTNDIACPCVIPDDKGGGALGTKHLANLGYQRIAFINGPVHYEASQARLAGYQQAVSEAGLRFDPALVRTCDKWYERLGFEAARDLLEMPSPPDAIFCASDSLASGALEAAQWAGQRVPDDLALVGFDDRHFAAHKRLPLTTVALPLYEMGRLAAQLLLNDTVGSRQEASLIQVPCTLVERESCGAGVRRGQPAVR